MKESRFVHYYIKTGGNGVKSAQKAGYNGNYNTLAVTACQNLNKPKIVSELKRRMSKVLTSNEVLEKLSDVAESDVKLSGSDKLKALELLGKSHKLFTDRVETADVADVESRKAFLSDQLQRLRAAHANDDFAYNRSVRQLRSLFTDTTDPAYDPLLDYTKHPENWPDVSVEVKEVDGVQ